MYNLQNLTLIPNTKFNQNPQIKPFGQVQYNIIIKTNCNLTLIITKFNNSYYLLTNEIRENISYYHKAENVQSLINYIQSPFNNHLFTG
jgi:hypothetical protein